MAAVLYILGLTSLSLREDGSGIHLVYGVFKL